MFYRRMSFIPSCEYNKCRICILVLLQEMPFSAQIIVFCLFFFVCVFVCLFFFCFFFVCLFVCLFFIIIIIIVFGVLFHS